MILFLGLECVLCFSEQNFWVSLIILSLTLYESDVNCTLQVQTKYKKKLWLNYVLET